MSEFEKLLSLECLGLPACKNKHFCRLLDEELSESSDKMLYLDKMPTSICINEEIYNLNEQYLFESSP